MMCEKLAGCPFYNDKMPIESSMGKLYKLKYCEGDKTICARYMVCTKLGKEFVPDNLFPNMKDRAEQIIKENNE